jgi:hypothetical protein
MLKGLVLFLYLFFLQYLFSQNPKNLKDNEIHLEYIKDINLFHSPPEPLFIGRPFELSLVTELSESIIISVLLFFKTDSMKTYREILLNGESGLYKYKVNTKDFPGNSIDYFFAVRTKDGKIYGAPVDENNILMPIKKNFIDPVQYYKQKKRLNQ